MERSLNRSRKVSFQIRISQTMENDREEFVILHDLARICRNRTIRSVIR